MNRMMLKTWMVMLVAFSMAAGAEEPSPRFNQIHFQVQRERAVDNDRMRAGLIAIAEDANVVTAAGQVNTTMAWALKLAKAQANIEVRNGDYQTQQLHEPQTQTVRAWQVTQELIIEGADFAQLNALIGRLQQRLHVTSMGFSVSARRRATVEDELIAQALDAFQQRADLVRRQLKAARYRIVDANVDTGGLRYQPIWQGTMAAPMARVAPPATEAGTSTVTVTVNGRIELQ